MNSFISKPAWAIILLMSAALTCLLPAGAQDHSYQTFKTKVAFRFKAGNRMLKAGTYELVVVGPGLLVLRDEKAHPLMTLLTRTILQDERPAPARWVFSNNNGESTLAQVWMPNNQWGLEILGEEVAMREKPRSRGVMLLPDQPMGIRPGPIPR